ncbi:hypothetical protein FOE78_18310 [Microlunatus elymi]|uniref:Trehalose 2-sulfotransferase n=1 Tax=Microlunatus elymi TaxID=2596828 RepID=A0A516Q2E2_9ACTN|nr:Stf0 family sulfotransferase [Microlunatus elymi]QDP97604.1 hypothetical protein FOE78_18310 [Microlunatus elymi]
MAPVPERSYLICGTPRTGSTFLCGLLASTGAVGRPESYFRIQNESDYARQWSIDQTDGCVDQGAFVAAAIAAGSTANGIFGCRVMWGSLDNVVAKIDPSIAVHSPQADLGLLQRAFEPGLTFVYLSRQDVLAQAVSWARAEQTAYWQTGDVAAGEPHFDPEQIDLLGQTIEEHNAAWRSWFAAAGVRPLAIAYEELVADPVRTVRDLLDQLGIEIPTGTRIAAPDRRQSDELNEGWLRQFRTCDESRPRPGRSGPSGRHR